MNFHKIIIIIIIIVDIIMIMITMSIIIKTLYQIAPINI